MERLTITSTLLLLLPVLLDVSNATINSSLRNARRKQRIAARHKQAEITNAISEQQHRRASIEIIAGSDNYYADQEEEELDQQALLLQQKRRNNLR